MHKAQRLQMTTFHPVNFSISRRMPIFIRKTIEQDALYNKYLPRNVFFVFLGILFPQIIL